MSDSAARELRAELDRQLAEWIERYQIGPDRYCGWSPTEISRLVVADHARPAPPGEPVGYWPGVSEEAQAERFRAEFGPGVDVARLRAVLQFFEARVAETLRLDWQLPNDEFDRAVVSGLDQHYPELTALARQLIAAACSYSHAK